MSLRRLIQLAGASLCLLLSGRAEENVWPLAVTRSDQTGTAEWAQYVGPIFFHRHQTDGKDIRGFRPLFLTTRTGEAVERNLFYPLFTWKSQPGYSSFSFFHLIEHQSNAGDTRPRNDRFDIWPVYFSRHASDPEKSYQAFFPIGGTLKNRLGRERISFVLWPLYMQTEKKGRVVTNTPWPIIRSYSGPGYDGFEVWPLFGRNTHAGDYDHRFYLWPLFHYSLDNMAAPVPDKRVVAIPFYASASGPGYISQTYVWPFFGYTHRTQPDVYDERRYFWPFLVQGRGSERMVNRWAPFYTHSIVKGNEKTWYLFPLYRHMDWQSDGLQQDKRQFLFFLYWSLQQRSLTNPAAAPAHKTHVWPLFTSWDNGAGRRQVQALSPFEVLFSRNEKIRQLWSPLFALYQYDRQPDTTVRHTFLWNAITWRRSPDSREFHLGPLFETKQDPELKRWSIGCGLFGFRRATGGSWRPFLFDFRPKAANKASSAASP
jgi:hypothetical protein